MKRANYGNKLEWYCYRGTAGISHYIIHFGIGNIGLGAGSKEDLHNVTYQLYLALPFHDESYTCIQRPKFHNVVLLGNVTLDAPRKPKKL